MKKVCILLLTVISFTASAQTFIGIKGGPGFTNASADNFFEGLHYRIGYSAGIGFEHFLTDWYVIGADLLVGTRGFRHEIFYRDNMGNPTRETAMIEFNYDYISLPLRLHITPD